MAELTNVIAEAPNQLLEIALKRTEQEFLNWPSEAKPEGLQRFGATETGLYVNVFDAYNPSLEQSRASSDLVHRTHLESRSLTELARWDFPYSQNALFFDLYHEQNNTLERFNPANPNHYLNKLAIGIIFNMNSFAGSSEDFFASKREVPMALKLLALGYNSMMTKKETVQCTDGESR